MTNNSNFTIRAAKASDLENVLSLFEGTVRKTCSKDYSQKQIDAWVSSVHDKQRWLDKFQSQYFILIKWEGKLAGFGSIGESGYLDFMYVHYAYQGKGIASMILNELLDYVSKFNPTKVYSDVSISAKPFFEKQGFKVIREQTVSRQGVKLTNFRMEKKLRITDFGISEYTK